MPSSPPLEDQVQALAARLADVESRLAALEGRAPDADPSAAFADVAAPVAGAPLFALDGLRLTTALGRSLIILGGAFLLRALTDAGTWPPFAGVFMGLLYGLGWMGTSAVAARRHDRVRALFDGGTALVIGFPLIVEATFRFKLLGPGSSAVMLGVVTAGSLVAASFALFQTLAWLAAVGGMATGLILLVGLGAAAPFSIYFTALGISALALSSLRGWRALRWPTGVLAAAVAAGVTLRATSVPPVDAPALAWLAQGVLLTGYLGAMVVGTLALGETVGLFELVQASLVTLVGVGGAWAVSQSAGSGSAVLGALLVAVALAGYGLGVRVLPHRSRDAVAPRFFTTLGLVFLLAGLEVATSGVVRAVALTACAALLAAAWRRSADPTFGVHTAVALVAAAAAGGVGVVAASALMGGLADGLSARTTALVLVVALVAIRARPGSVSQAGLTVEELPTLTLSLVALAAAAGLLTLAAATATGIAPASAGILATERTALLSAIAVGLARLNRPGPFTSLGRLAYPLLAVIGLKFVASDLRVSSASTLFVALACYGIALVLVPRLRHR